MKKLNIEIETYEYRDGFRVDIYKNTDEYEEWEAYLYHKDYSIKMGMFGVSTEDFPKEEFIDMVAEQMEEYILYYERDYMN